MIEKIFDIVATALMKTATFLHLTYNEINIIVYFFIIPLTWCIMLDRIFKTYYISCAWTAFCLILFLVKIKSFSTWCDTLFDKSVNFLLSFEAIGWDYSTASVIICVVIPILIYIVLTILLICKS